MSGLAGEAPDTPGAAIPANWSVQFRDRIDSTNEEARRLLREGAEAGTVVWARTQDRGRGRRGRCWVSPPGNLYCSILLRPDCPPVQAAQLGFVAALALGDAVGPGLPDPGALRFKWPNDVLIGGRKCAGILLESEMGKEGRAAWVVIGIGVNIRSAPAETEYPATALVNEGFAEIAPEALLNSLCDAFFEHARVWAGKGFGPIRAAWVERAENRGKEIRVRLNDSSLTGRFADLDADGALLLETAEGLRRVTAGDVFPSG